MRACQDLIWLCKDGKSNEESERERERMDGAEKEIEIERRREMEICVSFQWRLSEVGEVIYLEGNVFRETSMRDKKEQQTKET